MKYGTIEAPSLRLANTATTDPIQHIFEKMHQPFRQSGTECIQIIPLLPYDHRNSDGLSTLIDGLKGNITSRNYRGFEKTFGPAIEIHSPRYYTTLSDAIDSIDIVSKRCDLKSTILLVCLEQSTPPCGFYHKLKIQCITRGLPSQFITIDTLNQPRGMMGAILRNISIAIFSKNGGLPWVLEHPLKDLHGVVGLNIQESSIQRRTEYPGVIAAEVFDRNGLSNGRSFLTDNEITRFGNRFIGLKPKRIESVMTHALKRISARTTETHRSIKDRGLTVHISNSYPPEVLDSIAQVIMDHGYDEYKVIQIKNKSVIRLFNPSQQSERVWPMQGLWGFIESNRRAFLYTSGIQHNFERNEPSTYDKGEVVPIELILEKGTNSLNEDDLNHVMQLTKLHHYTTNLSRIRLPITITLSRKTAILSQCGLSDFLFDASFLY